MREFNPQLWFGERELKFMPPHFVKCYTPITPEGLTWVKTKLSGRYCLVDTTNVGTHTFVFDNTFNIAFEDPSDAVMYELRWSGSK